MHATTTDVPGRFPAAARPGGLRARAAIEAVGYGLFWLFLFFTCFTFLRPSPYDFVAIPTLLLWSLLGLRFHRAALAIYALLLIYGTCLVLSLMPYLDETLSGEWTFQSVYLIVTGVFFVMFFSDETHRRVELALNAYLASCLFASLCGILSYFDVLGDGVLFKMDGRASGVFEDPNLLGSFLVLGALYLAHNVITGRTRRVLGSLTALLVILACIFLSFSRGSWGACVLGIGLMATMAWITAPTRALRRRIAGLGAVALVCGAATIGGLLAMDGIAARFSDRAVATKDYDEGETGRFGNQRRGMEMLLERPEGFGPLRWRRVFNLEPHNSYIGAFSNGGWIAGFTFLGIVIATGWVGFRLCLTPSPYQRLAQIAWPALLMFFLQAIQIDIEKWRHVYMMLGMVWGLHVARWEWLRTRSGAPR